MSFNTNPFCSPETLGRDGTGRVDHLEEVYNSNDGGAVTEYYGGGGGGGATILFRVKKNFLMRSFFFHCDVKAAKNAVKMNVSILVGCSALQKKMEMKRSSAFLSLSFLEESSFFP